MSDEVRIEYYALFSQATQGDAKPKDFSKVPEQFLEFTTRKHEAWQAKKGMDMREAKQAYMDFVNKLRSQ